MKNKKGFTLIEIIVVIGIISLFFSFSILYYKNINKKNAINDDIFLLKSDILNAENMTKAGVSDDKFSENNNYGIYINKAQNNKYYFYKDINQNNRFDSNEIIVETLLSGSYFYDLTSGNILDLLFSNSDMTLNNNKDIDITLSNNKTTKTLKIKIIDNNIIFYE